MVPLERDSVAALMQRYLRIVRHDGAALTGHVGAQTARIAGG